MMKSNMYDNRLTDLAKKSRQSCNPVQKTAIAGLALFGLLIVSSPAEAIQQVLEQTAARQERVLRSLLSNPYPPKNSSGGPGLWYYENFALAAYGLNEKTEEADAGLLTLQRDLFPAANAHFEAGAMHWHAYLQERIYWLYSSRSKHHPGRMSVAAENAILDMLWEWAAPVCRRELADTEKVWWMWGSENHHLMAWVSFWGAAQIFEAHPDYKDRPYADGTKPAQMAAAFDTYFKEWIRERASKGLLVEVASPTYSKYTLNTLYNLCDFADDPVLKKRADMLLNVYWADWAIEQIDGVRGGSRHRCYTGRASVEQSGGAEAAWFHFGVGVEASKHPGTICAATTFWRPHPLVTELALGAEDRGEYAVVSRRPGLAEQGEPQNYIEDPSHPLYEARGINRLEPQGGGLTRTSWCTPDFVAGMSVIEARPQSDWWAASAQNRWNGVIFAGHPTARVFTQRVKPDKARKSVYNSEWGVQNKGVMILQRLKTSDATGQMIWFDHSLKLVEKDGWVFVEAPQAYCAVRIVKGGGEWKADSVKQRRDGKGKDGMGKWLVLNNEFSPVIIETVRKKYFADFSSFQSAIMANEFSWEGQIVSYRSAFYNTVLTLPVDAGASPTVDGALVCFAPGFVYKSPYLNGKFGSGIVTIQKGESLLTLDFNEE
ncbi:hypothetical protein [Tichowtungia aerotolerans]|uniref:Heparin-sulfate lyase N-terminal domain-containing protein n=1 Tax=Tichowtungia aerotolerans TaxID=2697043 RepID=A0A6P1M779_9BACT|nr:hypothetical protein [Tichowtungia aerotolerans]QHI70619.1 hypothetical protein GT409_14615 [Tichowtungia aerotolerans]